MFRWLRCLFRAQKRPLRIAVSAGQRQEAKGGSEDLRLDTKTPPHTKCVQTEGGTTTTRVIILATSSFQAHPRLGRNNCNLTKLSSGSLLRIICRGRVHGTSME